MGSALLPVLLLLACFMAMGSIWAGGAWAAEPEAAESAETSEEEEDGWEIAPYMTLGVAVWVQEYKASAAGTLQPGVEVATNRSVPLSTLFVDLEGGLMGPKIHAFPGQPRPFLRGGVLLPTNGNSTIQAGTSQFRVTGQVGLTFINSPKVLVEWDPIYVAGLGIEFVIPGDLGIRLSPSFEFRKARVRYAGEFERVELRSREERGRITFEGKQESGQTFVGPGLRAAIGFDPIAGVEVSGFLDAALLWDVEGTHQRFSATDPTLGTIEFDFEAETTAIEVGTGFTIAW